MKPTFKKLEVPDLSNLEKLVAENIEGIEPGLRVIDARLCLGQAAIDLVALDARKALVLVALDFAADEGLLLRVMDAYSWCREYPDTLRRLYPMANVSATRPPRILFIVERVTDAFVRRIKQLSFLEIDCLEFRHLEVNGASAVYFDLVERLRRAAPVEPLSDDERVIITTPVRTPKRIEAESPVVQPAWRPVAEPPAVQPSAWAPATADHAPFVAPEPAPSVEEVASTVPGLGVSLESRMAELCAELSAEETPPAIETPRRIEAEPPVVQPAWRPVAEPPAVEPSAGPPATADHAPFVAPEPAPSVEEVASTVPELGVSLESRMAELFAELSTEDTPSVIETPTRIEAEPPVVQPAWRPVAEPPPVQPSAGAPATADYAPFVAPEPAPSVEEVASTVPGLGVSLESRMAELFAELSAEETPSAIETPTRIEAEPPVVQPAWPSFPEPQAVQASAVASASSDSAPFQAPEPAPSVEEVASAVPEVGVSLESRMAELFAELSAAEIPSSAEMPTEEYAAPEEEHAVPSLEVVDAEAVTDEPPLRLESIDATARQEEPESPSRSADVEANSDLQTLLRELHVETQPEIEPPTDEAEVESTERAAEAPAEAPVETNAAAVEERADAELIGCSGGHVDPTGRSCWHDPSAVCFCQCHASQAAAPAEVETPAPATTRPFWAKPSANKVLPPSGGRTYFFSQVARDSAPARQTVAPWQQVPAPAQPPPAASSRLPATPAAHTAAPAPQPAAAAGPKPVVAKRKEPIPDHPELESLHFPKDGLSRQWLEFLNQLNGAK